MSSELGLLQVVSMAFRLLALVGRFGFAIVAYFFLDPADYGIYGLVTAGTYVFAQVAGLEAFQTVVRRIVVRNEEGSGEIDERPNYLRFVALSSLVSLAMGLGLGMYFAWPVDIILLVGAIVWLEYIGIETMRLLTAARMPELALYSVSVRFFFWSFGFPIAGLAGAIPAPWDLRWIFSAWLVSSIVSLGFFWPIRRCYFRATNIPFWGWYWNTLRHSPKWLAIALPGRFIETGVRLVPGFLIDETAAGRFTFIASIAAMGGTALKASVEPHYFAAMVDSRSGTAARRAFARITVIVSCLGVLFAYSVWFCTKYYVGKDLGPHSGTMVGLLSAAAVAMSYSQVPHFDLYAAHRDREILKSCLWTLAIGLPLVFGATLLMGIVGTALGTAVTASIILGLKLLYARKRYS